MEKKKLGGGSSGFLFLSFFLIFLMIFLNFVEHVVEKKISHLSDRY